MAEKICRLKNKDIIPYLTHDLHKNLFALYICETFPEEESFAVVDETAAVLGVHLCGATYQLYPAWGGWFVCQDPRVLALLLKSVLPEECVGAQIHWDLREVLEESFVYSCDRYLLCSPRERSETPHQLIVIDENALKKYLCSNEIKSKIGNLDELPRQRAFWGWVEENEIIAVAETYVRYKNVASLQQVYTKESKRRKGISFQLLRAVLNRENEIEHFTYLVSESNTASLHLAYRLGFKDLCSFACIESVKKNL